MRVTVPRVPQALVLYPDLLRLARGYAELDEKDIRQL